MALRDYYSALSRPEPLSGVAELLRSDESVLVNRVIWYLWGGKPTWPRSVVTDEKPPLPTPTATDVKARLYELTHKAPIELEVRRRAVELFALHSDDRGDPRRIELIYTRTGREFGIRAWTGQITASRPQNFR